MCIALESRNIYQQCHFSSVRVLSCVKRVLSAQGGVNEKTQHKYTNIKKAIKI